MCITKPLAELERWLVIKLNNGERLYSRVNKDEASDKDPLTNVYELAKERVLCKSKILYKLYNKESILIFRHTYIE